MAQGRVIALLGGGQLGRMFIENALRYDVEVHVLDPDPGCPCAQLAHRYVQGSFKDKETVLAFAKDADVVSIEIEHVSVSALETLKAQGKLVVPDPAALRTIQDKGLQKSFYQEHGIPTSSFELLADRSDLEGRTASLPAFLKARTGGYDGKGVMALDGPDDLQRAFEGPYVLEERVEVASELAVIAVRGTDGAVATYPVVEMVFDPVLNLVDHLLVPASVSEEVSRTAEQLALQVVDGLASPGIFAVELFLTRDGRVLVNETAPRAHNSGHFSIEACPSSQFDQMLRVLMEWPLGATDVCGHAAMVNLVGEGGSGPVHVEGLSGLLGIPGAHFHLYGKQETRTGRKMGHVTLTDPDRERLDHNIRETKRGLRIVPAAGKQP